MDSRPQGFKLGGEEERLQDGNDQYHQTNDSQGRLDGVDRHSRRLLPCTNPSEASKISQVHSDQQSGQENGLSFSDLTNGVDEFTVGTVSDHRGNNTETSKQGPQTLVLRRRSHSYGQDERGMPGESQTISGHTGTPGDRDQQGQSQTTPTQVLEHLGFIINSKKDRISISATKRREMGKETRRFLRKDTPKARTVASLLGKINFLSYAIPILRWKKRPLEQDLTEFLRNQDARRKHT